ncbi:Protein sof1 [Mitosporidium daphniae]
MKIQVLSHSFASASRERNQDMPKTQVNMNPELHPFSRPRELTRALNVVKLERLFAKPFVGALSGHNDGVYAMAKHTRILNTLLSGSADGELRLWDISSKKTRWNMRHAHSRFVRALSFVHNDHSGSRFVSGSDDGFVHLWDTSASTSNSPIRSFEIGDCVSGLDHHPFDNTFVTAAGGVVSLWNHDRNTATTRWSRPGLETLTHVRFNSADASILGTCGLDRTVGLLDLRMDSPLARVTLTMKSNSLCWNPMEPLNFAVANEDSNAYLFDMRRLDMPLNVLEGHTSALLDLDFSPTGEELVSGSYDHTLRIFSTKHGRSRDVYHTKRMQKVFSVRWSMDNQFIFSSSDDGSIRYWRSQASSRSSALPSRQSEALNYGAALKAKYSQIPEVKRISTHRHIPKPISSAQREKRIILESQKRKEENRRKHSAPGAVPHLGLRSKIVERKES